MITLVGHGYIGSEIAKELKNQSINFHWCTHNDNDFAPWGSAIINAAGFTGSPNVDECEIRRKETILGNVVWPLRLIQMYSFLPIIHISSGCIYQGDNNGVGWSEEDEPNFTGSFYAFSKVVEQEALKPYLHKDYLLRIRMPFGKESHPRNLLDKLKNYPKLINSTNSISYVKDVARVAIWFALNLPKPGIYNLCNPGAIEIKEIVEMMRLEKDWFTWQEFSRIINAPRSMCVLNTEKLQSTFPIQDVRSALNECIGVIHPCLAIPDDHPVY